MLRDAAIVAIVPAANIEEAKRFYGEKLDLPRADVRVPGDDAVFEGGNGTRLYVYETEAGRGAEHTLAVWIVEDVEETVEELSEKGIVFETYDMPQLKTDERGIADIEGVKAAWFKDPEGNILSVTEAPW